jgi:hypothetical protein
MSSIVVPSPPALRLLRVVAALMFLGHGWTHWNLKMPLSALVWDEAWMNGVLQSIWGIDWSSWANDLRVERGMDAVSRGFGVFYGVCGVLCLVPLRAWWRGVVLGLGGLGLLLLAYLKFREADKGIGNLLEHGGQFATPWVLWWAERSNVRSRQGWPSAMVLAKIALVFTFVFHGLFAFGLPAEVPFWDHGTPVHFVEMTMLSLGLESESIARMLLRTAGVVDWLAAVLILLPRRPLLQKVGLIYMASWGALTALARPWAYVQSQEVWASANTWLPEMLLRTPHWGLALVLLLSMPAKEAQGEVG